MKSSNLFLLAVATTLTLGSAYAKGPGNGGGMGGGSQAGAANSGASAGNGTRSQTQLHTQTPVQDQTQDQIRLNTQAQIHTPGTGLVDPSLRTGPAGAVGTPRGIHTPGTGLTTTTDGAAAVAQ
jgi:hypothetical protein